MFKIRKKVIICLIQENDRISTRQDVLINIEKKNHDISLTDWKGFCWLGLTTDKTKDGSSIEHHPDH